jgi:hypothetical protein
VAAAPTIARHVSLAKAVANVITYGGVGVFGQFAKRRYEYCLIDSSLG